jgi:hypothetical protein
MNNEEMYLQCQRCNATYDLVWVRRREYIFPSTEDLSVWLQKHRHRNDLGDVPYKLVYGFSPGTKGKVYDLD